MKSIGRQSSRGATSGIAFLLAIPMLTACGSSGRNQQLAGNYYAPVRNQYPYSNQNTYPGTSGLGSSPYGYTGTAGGSFSTPRYGQPGVDPMMYGQRAPMGMNGLGMNGQFNRGGFGANGGFGINGGIGMGNGGCPARPGMTAPCGAQMIPCAPGQVCQQPGQPQPPAAPGANPSAPAAPGDINPAAATAPVPPDAVKIAHKTPRWEEADCDKTGADSDGDLITDDCENKLSATFKALDPKKYNGYAVGGVTLDPTIMSSLVSTSNDKELTRKCFSGETKDKKFNQCLADALFSITSRSQFDREAIRTIYNAHQAQNKAALVDPSTDASKMVAGPGEGQVTLIRGGYEEPPLLSLDALQEKQFSTTLLTGLATTETGLGDNSKFMYLVESCVLVPRATARIELVTQRGTRPGGVVFITEDGNLEASAIDISKVHGDAKKVQAKLPDRQRGTLNGGKVFKHFLAAVILPFEKDDTAREMLNFNFLVQLDNGDALEFMPQEISRVGADCPDHIKESLVLPPFTIHPLQSDF